MSEITGLWVHAQGKGVAVQLNEETILVTDYTTDPPTTTEQGELTGDAWIAALPVLMDGEWIR